MNRIHNLRHRAIKGTFWVTIANILARIVSFISMPVLARLLSKNDFGVFGIITTVTMICQVVVSFGFDLWYVKSNKQEYRRYAIFVKISIISIFLICAALAGLAHPLGNFYQDIQLERMMYWLALYFFIGGAAQLLRQQLAKHLEFRKTSQATIARQIVQAAASIILAIYLKNVYALFIGFAAGGVIEFLILLSATWSVIIGALKEFTQINAWREIKRYGKFTGNTVAGQLVNTTARYISTPIFGKIAGFNNAGLFVAMDNLITQPLSIITGSISTTSLSVLSKVPRQNLYNVAARISRLLLVITAPFFVFLWLFAEPTIDIVLGAKWVDGANILRLLMIPAFLNIVVSPISQLFIIFNKPHRLLYWNLALFILNVTAILVGNHYGFTIAVAAYAIAGAIMRLILQIMTSRLLGVKPLSFLMIYGEFLPLWAILTIPGLIIKYYSMSLPIIAIYAILGLAIYILIIRTRRPDIREEMNVIFQTIKFRRSAVTDTKQSENL